MQSNIHICLSMQKLCIHISSARSGMVWASMAYRHFLGRLKSILPLLFWDSYKIKYFMHNARSATDTSTVFVLALIFFPSSPVCGAKFKLVNTVYHDRTSYGSGSKEMSALVADHCLSLTRWTRCRLAWSKPSSHSSTIMLRSMALTSGNQYSCF